MKGHIIIDILSIILISYFILQTINNVFMYKTVESFIDTSSILKTCNKVKRKSRARIYNLKDKVERNVRGKIRDTYNVSKSIMKTILFPKEIKITF